MPRPAKKDFAKPPPKPPKYDFKNFNGTDLTDGTVWLLEAGLDYDSGADAFRNHCKKWAKDNGYELRTQAVDNNEMLITADQLKALRAKNPPQREFGVKVKFWPEGTEQPGEKIDDDETVEADAAAAA